MRSYDFSPLWRSTVGFDRLFDLVETAQRAGEDNYPPYNIERLGDDSYQISLAVAGFSPEEISITAEQNVVTIEGTRSEKTEREWAGPLPTGRECLKQQHEQARPPRRMHYHNARVVPVIDNRARGMHGGGSSQRARGRHIAA